MINERVFFRTVHEPTEATEQETSLLTFKNPFHSLVAASEHAKKAPVAVSPRPIIDQTLAEETPDIVLSEGEEVDARHQEMQSGTLR